MTAKNRWDAVYGQRDATSVSWYAPHLQQSMRYVLQAAPHKAAAIIDVGGGESTLVDDLLAEGYSKLAVLDISAAALEATKLRLGEGAQRVSWRAADVLEAELPVGAYDVWHDRAVFHFLVSEGQRRRYVAQALKALKPGGYAVVGTFGPEGPVSCSGLPVSRYSTDELHGAFGEPFQLIDSSVELHTTPWDSTQQFVYCFCRRGAQ